MLTNPTGCGTGKCVNTVWMGEGCHTPEVVNYILFGWINKLCYNWCSVGWSNAIGFECIPSHFREERMVNLVRAWGWVLRAPQEVTDRKAEWAVYGYHYGSGQGRVPAGDRSDCRSCEKPYPVPLTAYWIGMGYVPRDPYQ